MPLARGWPHGCTSRARQHRTRQGVRHSVMLQHMQRQKSFEKECSQLQEPGKPGTRRASGPGTALASSMTIRCTVCGKSILHGHPVAS